MNHTAAPRPKLPLDDVRHVAESIALLRWIARQDRPTTFTPGAPSAEFFIELARAGYLDITPADCFGVAVLEVGVVK